MSEIELVFLQNDKPVTDSLTVAHVFGKNHADVLRDIRNVLSSVDAEWGISNFAETPYRHPQNSQEYRKFVMTEDGFAILVMGYTGKEAMRWKIQFLKKFHEMQEQLQKGVRELSRLELIELARESELARLESEKRQAQLMYQLQEQQPKVVFADAVSVSQSTILIRELAIILKQNGINIGQQRLFEWLRENGYLIKRAGTDRNTPTQKAMELGLFEVKETPIVHANGVVTVSKTPKVTGKGQLYFINKFKAEEAKQLLGV